MTIIKYSFIYDAVFYREFCIGYRFLYPLIKAQNNYKTSTLKNQVNISIFKGYRYIFKFLLSLKYKYKVETAFFTYTTVDDANTVFSSVVRLATPPPSSKTKHG